jgi:bacillithiol synthase
MEPACLRHTELPHTSRLFSDFLYQYHRVERFYTTPPSAGYPEDRRAEMVAALEAQNGSHASLDVLSQPGSVAVVTGQQVGLFSGPAYTLYKALTAAKLAEQLTSTGTPAVPVFWLATEDHDFAEVNHSWGFDEAHHPVRYEVNGQAGNNRPVGTIEIAHWPINELRQSLSGLPFADDVLGLVEETYGPGISLGAAFQKLLEKLLKPYGFLFIDPLHPATRKLAAPMLQGAVRIGQELNQLLLNRSRELESAGYHSQVHVAHGTSLFFLLEEGKRIPVRDLKYTPDQLADRAEQISPNALLRPVVQDYMLPTAAYIGGPAEIAYFAQSQVLYQRLLGHMPRVVSRSGFTLFDNRSAKLMERYGLRPKDFFRGEESLRETVASRLIPAELEQRFAQVSNAVAESIESLEQQILAFDPTLAAATNKSRSKMTHQLTKIRSKVARETMRRNEKVLKDAEFLYNAVYPHKHLQERFYSILPFLARHGFELVDRLYEAVRLDCPDHILLQV